MSSHIVVAAVLCALNCEAVELRVWDGDTFRIGFGARSERVRLVSIDAPEIEGRCQAEVDLAERAKRRLAELLRGRQVLIVRSGFDRHGRTLASVKVQGRDVGEVLVREGLARTWSGRREPWCW